MDYVDFIVHVFSPEKRAFYGLERLRKTATTIGIAELNAELKAAVAANRAKHPAKAGKRKAIASKPGLKAVPAKKAATTKKAKKAVAPKKAAARSAGKPSKRK
jgi:ribosome-associated protein